MGKTMQKNKAKVLVLGGCAAAIAVGGTLAYLTATDSAVNDFSVSQALQGKVTVTEPSWQPEKAKDILPSQTVPKDPQMTNSSAVDVYAIMQVAVPKGNVVVASQDGTPQPAAERELFTYKVNPGWTELGAGEASADGSKTVHTYLLDAPLAPGATTDPVFDEVTLVNATDKQIDGANLSIEVNGFAIQKEGFANAEEAWKAYKKQNA